MSVLPNGRKVLASQNFAGSDLDDFFADMPSVWGVGGMAGHEVDGVGGVGISTRRATHETMGWPASWPHLESHQKPRLWRSLWQRNGPRGPVCDTQIDEAGSGLQEV